MGAKQSLQRYQDKKAVEAAAEGRLDGIAVSRALFEARGLGLVRLPGGLVARMADAVTVDVSENRFDSFPASICTLGSLQRLVAHDNRLHELPRSFGDLFSLTELDLSRNMLEGHLPDSIASLRGLKQLRLQQNSIKSLPDDFGRLTRLTHLGLDHNVIGTIPQSFTKLVGLKELGLSYNSLTSTHQHMDRLTSLRKLDLSYNRLSTVPPLEGLTNLQSLSLESNKLRSPLPALCFQTLRNLKSLSLGGSDNRLRSLPPTWTGDFSLLTVPRSMLETRKEAGAEGAAARAVAERRAAAVASGAGGGDEDELLIDPLYDPRVARVASGSRLAGGRVVTSHQVLTILAAAEPATKEDYNGVNTIRKGMQLGAQMSRQQQARVAEEEGDGDGDDDADGEAAAGIGGSSRARSRGGGSRGGTRKGEDDEEDDEDSASGGDPSLQQLSSLRTLALQRCGLRLLPDAFGAFQSLTALDLSNNRHLQSLPETVAALPKLDTLLVRGCALQALPTTLGKLSSLTCLHVQQNKLTVLPPSIGRLRQLTELDASGNATLLDLPLQLAQGCVRLETLRLGECVAMQLPPNLADLASLARITVAARQVAVAAAEVRELLESGRIEVTLT